MRTARSRAALAAAGILTLTLTSCAAGEDGTDLEQNGAEASAPADTEGGPGGDAGTESDLPGTPVSEVAPHLPVNGALGWNDTQETAVNWVLPEAYASAQFRNPDGSAPPLSITTDDGIIFADQSGMYLLPWDGSETRLLTSVYPGEDEEVSTELSGTELELDGQRGIVTLLIPEEGATWPAEPQAVMVMADGTETILDVTPELTDLQADMMVTVDASDSTFEGGSVPMFTPYGSAPELFHLDAEAGAIAPSPMTSTELAEDRNAWHWIGEHTAHVAFAEGPGSDSAEVTFYEGNLYPWTAQDTTPVAAQSCTIDEGFDDFHRGRLLARTWGGNTAGTWVHAGPAQLEVGTGEVTCLEGIAESSPTEDGALWLSNPEDEVRLVPAGATFADGSQAMIPEPGDVVVVPGMTSPDGAWVRMHRTDVHGYTPQWTTAPEGSAPPPTS
ncbi:MAG: hypothetical protein ACTH3G_10900 [Citricoccus sp.]